MKRIVAFALTLVILFAFIMQAGAVNSDVPQASAVEAFSFLYFGDIQITENAEADYAAWGELAKGAVRRNPGATFALQGGDIVESGIDQKQWDVFLKNADTALGVLPFFPTNGNHESNFLSGKPELYLQTFNLPQNGPDGFKEEFYAFDYGDAHILVLNSWVFSGEQRLTDEDIARLDAWVAADLARSTATWKIVLTHMPVYAVHSDVTANKMREHWAKIFEKYGVSLVLVGHQHVYSRLKPMTGGAVDYKDGVTQIMGNSGRKHYSSANETNAERTIYDTATYQVIQLDGKSMTVQCFDGDGTELDFVALSPRATNVTRLEYIETLWRAAGSPAPKGAHPFTDAPPSDALAWSVETGLIIGYGGSIFGTDDTVTHGQIAIIRERAAKNGG